MKALSRFNRIFDNKGNIGPIAEKSKRNFELILNHKISKTERVYNFCIGHAFRNIDKSLFKFELNETSRQMEATQYKSLLKENFVFEKQLLEIITAIRDCNSHYVHTFDRLKLLNDTNLLTFIKEAFEFSVIVNYIKEKESSFSDFKKNKLVNYLVNKFFPNKKYQKRERESFLKLNLNQAIEYLLFIEVNEEKEWKINKEYYVFSIKRGKYLSHEGQLFVLALFLYKNEAEQLISRISGFKRSEDKFHYKRDIFTFFSKKYSSQDIHSEEKYLIRFRDIIQYLNRYPTVWNPYIEPKRTCPEMLDALEKHIIEKEIFRSFPTYTNKPERDRFLAFAINNLFTDKLYLFNFENLNFSNKEIERFNYEIDISPELKDIDAKIKRIGFVNKNTKEFREKGKLQKRKKELKEENNPIKEKLIERIEKEILIKSYGRNIDRFMSFAIRFLAEENYFGKEAKFKLYKFYSSDEQNDFLNTLSQKEKDKLKYHNSRIVHYCTYRQHMEKYPDWDTPFVVQNNAIQAILKFEQNDEKLFSFQRNLIIYFLEDAFYNIESDGIKNKGKLLLKKYYYESLLVDFKKAKNSLSKNNITTLHRKLLPKRLLYNYQKPQRDSNFVEENPLKKILIQTKEQEKRYNLMLEKANRLGLKDEFLVKNKGKQFKLRFIKKAWHIMYFKDIYLGQSALRGHHKSLHITKEEFNDFSKWMYVFDEVPQYKTYLRELLEQKNFFDNNEFKTLFDTSETLEKMYALTKEKFQNYINSISNTAKVIGGVENYEHILAKDIVYINLSHFINFISQEKIIEKNGNKINFIATENVKYLVPEYYYQEKIANNDFKENKKLFNKLRKIKLEDALLYELAFKYLHVDKSISSTAKNNVDTLLTSSITYQIKNANNEDLYVLRVPFNRLEILAVLIQHKTDQQETPKNRKTSFLGNLYKYLMDYKSKSGDIKIIASDFQNSKTISFEDLNKINNEIIASSVKMSIVLMELEKFYILKYKTLIAANDNHIKVKEIKNNNAKSVINNYLSSKDRNKVFHFGVPDKNYNEIIEEIERKFIEKEIDKTKINSFDDLDSNIKTVCKELMEHTLSDKCRKRQNSTKEENDREFEKRYYKEKIK